MYLCSLPHTAVTVTGLGKWQEGILGFYSGFGITIMREIPFSLVQFPLYEYMKVTIISLQLLQETNVYLHLNDFYMTRTYRIDVI